MSYAIDFGTSNTVITRWNAATENGEIVKLSGISQPSPGVPPLIPSLVFAENITLGNISIGQTVRDRGLDLAGDPRCFRNFKRGIGAPIQGFLPEIAGKSITFEQVGDWFFGKMIDQLRQEAGTSPSSLVITVPVDSFESYRHWLTQICQTWGIEQVQLLDEPTAAALGYQSTEDGTILVIDFGGGTVDFSLVELNLGSSDQPQGYVLKWGEKMLGDSTSQKKKLARVIAKAGTNLGGSDIDNWLVDYFADTQGLAKSPVTLRLAERLKIKLSNASEAKEVYFNDQTFESYELSMGHAHFRTILEKHKFFQKLEDLLVQVLQQGRRNGIEKNDIKTVLVVGGTSQIPAVRDWLLQHFDEKIMRCDRPFEAVALGALELAQGYEINDFLYHSYGIRYWNRRNNCHSWHPIVRAGQPYPMARKVEFKFGASVEGQPQIELILGELGAETTNTEVYFDGDRLITRALGSGATTVQPLNDRDGARTIAQLDPLGSPGRDRINAKFWVDGERFLRLEVEDLLTRETLLDNQIVAQLS